MEKAQVAVLLQSMAERTRVNPSTGSVEVQISEIERAALLLASEYLRGLATPMVPLQPKPFPLRLDACAASSGTEANVLLCLDFGTAMSKAFARRLDVDEPLPLPIGGQAGQSSPTFSLVSSVYITHDGRFWFGQEAVNKSLAGRASGQLRIDSIKDVLAKGEVRLALGEELLDASRNPTAIRFSERDVLVMYLAFLSDQACSVLESSYRVSRYVKRRFTFPVFDRGRAEWAGRELVTALAEAQVLADTFHGQWKQGISAEDVAAALRAVADVSPPTHLVDPAGVTEPIAAVASRAYGSYEPVKHRQLLAVVDVGAGTIDFALFFRVGIDGSDQFQLLPGSEKALRQAGNQVDNLLAGFILDRAGVRPADQDYHRIATSLALQVRSFKEALFRDGTVAVPLANDRVITVAKAEFCTCNGVRQLESEIHRTFEDMLRSVDESWITGVALMDRIVLFTGGGADLPFIRSLDGKEFRLSRPVSFRAGTPRPRWIQREHPELSDEYPRIAVAIGGSSAKLPRMLDKSFAVLGATQTVYTPEVVRKGL